jgi:uncharacterized membrane protein YgdD (TMEM256/DUF423 family)
MGQGASETGSLAYQVKDLARRRRVLAVEEAQFYVVQNRLMLFSIAMFMFSIVFTRFALSRLVIGSFFLRGSRVCLAVGWAQVASATNPVGGSGPGRKSRSAKSVSERKDRVCEDFDPGRHKEKEDSRASFGRMCSLGLYFQNLHAQPMGFDLSRMPYT